MISATSATSNAPLSLTGEEMSELLKLERKRIRHICPTDPMIARTTAKPKSDAIKVLVITYKEINSLFIRALKN